MSISELERFGQASEKTGAGLTYSAGFPRYQKPARQWFNQLFFTMTEKINAIIVALNTLTARQHYAVGDLYITVKNHGNAASVKSQHGYGTWARFGAGKALVGLSSSASDPAWTKSTSNTFGEYEHTLTAGQLPTDAFKVRTAGRHGARNHGGGGTTYASGEAGGLVGLAAEETGWNGESFDITQPSIVIEIWVRTA